MDLISRSLESVIFWHLPTSNSSKVDDKFSFMLVNELSEICSNAKLRDVILLHLETKILTCRSLTLLWKPRENFSIVVVIPFTNKLMPSNGRQQQERSISFRLIQFFTISSICSKFTTRLEATFNVCNVCPFWL